MTDEFFPFGSRAYLLMLLIVVFARGMDVLSTWVATPHLVLEGNPIAKKLGWRWGLLINAGFCLLLSFWPMPTIVISTTSILVAARNFQLGWLMRTVGEDAYRDWHVQRLQETRITLFLLCLAGNTLLTAAVGAGVMLFSGNQLIPFSIGIGIMGYAVAVAFYTLLGVWNLRRAALRKQRLVARGLLIQPEPALRASLENLTNIQPQGK
jgi:hypothetical protein